MKKIILLFILTYAAFISFSQVVIKMKREAGVSTIPGKVNGLGLKFIFDTGASDVSISMTEASFMLKNDYLNKDDILGTSNYLDANGNISVGVNINLREIEIGGLILYNVRASVVSNMKAPLLLGQSAISKLGIVQLDLEANTLTILNQGNASNVAKTSSSNNQEILDTISTNGTANNKIENLIEQAKNLYGQGSYQEVIDNCNLILLEQPQNTTAYLFRALSSDMMEDFKSAIQDYTKLISINPNRALYYCYRGKSKHDLKDYAGALLDLNKGLLIDSKNVEGYKWRAQTKEELKMNAGAMSDYSIAISLEPMDSTLYISRAIIKQELNDHNGAIVDCNKAISIGNDYSFAYYYRAISKRALKNISGAMEDLNRAIDIDSENASAYAQRGSIKDNYYDDYDGALEDLNKALTIDPSYIYASIMKTFLEQKMKENIWIKTTQSKDGDKWYIQNTVVSKNESLIKLWVKQEFKTTAIKINGKSATYSNGHILFLVLFNCFDKEYKFLTLNYYDSKGKMIKKTELEEYEDWQTPPPQTVIYSVLQSACEKYN